MAVVEVAAPAAEDLGEAMAQAPRQGNGDDGIALENLGGEPAGIYHRYLVNIL